MNKRKMIKWEYTTTVKKDMLTRLGLEGWEAYAIDNYGGTTYFLKRPIEEVE